MFTSIVVVSSLLIDAVVGEPRRWHPLVGFGYLASRLESALNNPVNRPVIGSLAGLVGWALLVLPFVYITWLLPQLFPGLDIVISIACLTLALGTSSLVQHARAVSDALVKEDLPLAREKVSLIVSRDTSQSDTTAINRATIESVLENGSDAIFAAIFWFVVLGAPGVVLYRLANTLDAMWGYKTPRYTNFGFVAARFDDILNWLPARLTALSYALVGDTRSALHCWRTQAREYNGINPGVVMATGAGALNVKLGGPACYHGEMIQRPELGCKYTPGVVDIERSIGLVYKSIIAWLLVIATGDYFIGF